MLSSLLLYLFFIALGILTGSRLLKQEKEYKWINILQMVALLLLIFTMGVRIGADQQVISSIGTLGVKALIITVCAIAGSVLFVCLGRKVMRIDRYGRGEESDCGKLQPAGQSQSGGEAE